MSSRCVKSLGLANVIFFLSLFVAPVSRAAVGFQPVNPDELKMTSEPLAPGAPAIILYREVNRNDAGIFNSHVRFEENYERIKVLTEEGRKYADIEIRTPRGFYDVTGLHARTIHPDGSVVEFNGQIFDKTLSKRKGLTYKAKTFTLPDVQVGSVLEFYYTINFESGYIFFSDWILSHELFQKQAKFILRPFAEQGYHINLRWSLHLPPGIREPQQGNDGIVKLEASNIPAFQTEDFMPPENEYTSRVDFVYSYDYYDGDVNKYWKTFGKKRNDEAEGFVSKRSALQDELSRIVSPTDSPESKLQKIYARVQQIRNTTYEPAKTEEEKKRQHEKDQANGEDVLKRGYGNEAQLNWLFLGLARAAGLEAYALAVSDREEYFFTPQSADGNRLDQTAVLIKLNGKDLYLSPGAAFAPFAMLKWQETGVPALRLDKNGGTWITTSLPDSSVSQIQRKAEMKLSDTGDLEGKATLTYTGLEGFRRRVDERNEDDVARKKYLEDELKGYIPVASEVKLSNRPDWRSSATPLVAEFSVKVPGWVSRGGRVALCPVALFAASEQHVFGGAQRTYPIYIEFPAQKIDDVLIDLPTGWQVSSLPKAQDDNYRIVAYSVGAENDKATLHLKRKLDVNFNYLEPKYYSPLRSFYQQVRTGDTEQVVLQPGTAVSSN